MKDLIACCGLDCENCDARKATVNNDDALRKKTANGPRRMTPLSSPSISTVWDAGRRA